MADDLEHSYDALKRREYYLKNRHLKGRKPGASSQPSTKRRAAAKPPAKTRAQRQAERRRHQEAQLALLKSRLEKLRIVLAEEVKKAQARSGGSSSKATSTQKSSQANQPVKKLTAAEKAKAAKAAKAYRAKNKDLSLDEQVKSLTEKIKTIQERIAKMRKDGSVGARKTPAK